MEKQRSIAFIWKSTNQSTALILFSLPLLLELELIPRRNRSFVFIPELGECISFVECGTLSQGSKNRLIGSAVSSPECPCLPDFPNLRYLHSWWIIAGIIHIPISKKNDSCAIYVKENHQPFWQSDVECLFLCVSSILKCLCCLGISRTNGNMNTPIELSFGSEQVKLFDGQKHTHICKPILPSQRSHILQNQQKS